MQFHKLFTGLTFLIISLGSYAQGQWLFIDEDPILKSKWYLETSKLSSNSKDWTYFYLKRDATEVIWDHPFFGNYESIEIGSRVNCETGKSETINYIYKADKTDDSKLLEVNSASFPFPEFKSPFKNKILNIVCGGRQKM